jgi:hypothetical protein
MAAALIWLLGRTLRYRDIVELGGVIHTRESVPGVFCFWHRSLLAAAHRFRNWPIGIVISQSFDGELIARTVERLGYTPLRGSSSRGGQTALRAGLKVLQESKNVAFTADGPRGPLYVAKPGAVLLAQAAGLHEVGAFYLHPIKAWRLKTWDEFLIPKPFSEVVVSFARTVPVAEQMSDAEFEQARGAVEAAIERARAAAERGSW